MSDFDEYRARHILPPDEYAEVNRLIIIGNGFDLAHGLKSSFKDFIDDYFFNMITRFDDNLVYEDELIRIDVRSAKEYARIYRTNLTRENAHKSFNEIVKQMPELTGLWRSRFFKAIVEHSEIHNWVDIEIIFFQFLSSVSRECPADVLKLNNDLQFIKGKLGEYLKREEHNLESYNSDELLVQFVQPFKRQEAKTGTLKSDKEVSSICFLNFNYTDILRKSVYYMKTPPQQCLAIHGTLQGDDESAQGPVFGFGDELDKDYLEFEDMKNDELFKHIKSFKYLQFDNYRRMLEFIEAFPFQVHIYGHSCGLSDRTLLNTIFEHENCISIKPFYYKSVEGDDYEQKTFAISRHFKSKVELRAKVVNKWFCEAMAQPRNN